MRIRVTQIVIGSALAVGLSLLLIDSKAPSPSRIAEKLAEGEGQAISNPPSTTENTKTQSTPDASQKSSSTEGDEFEAQLPKEKRLFQNLHEKKLAELRSMPVLEEKAWVDPRLGESIRTSLVKAPNWRADYYVIRERQINGQDVSYIQIANELLVSFKEKPSASELEAFKSKYGIDSMKSMLAKNNYLLSFKEVSLEKLEKLEKLLPEDEMIASLDNNDLVFASLAPNDTNYNLLWGLNNNGQDPVGQTAFKAGSDIDAVRAWENQTDCSSIPVAVLDTGIDPTHPDLADNILAGASRNYTSANINDFIDRQAHGSHVAGTIGAVGNNNFGITGVCWKAAIFAIKVLGDDGSGSLDSIVNGLTYAAQSPAKVLNMSLGRAPGAPAANQEAAAIKLNSDAGKLLAIAAGNDNNDNDALPSYPANYNDPGVISVAALHGGADLADFSNYGANTVHIGAPGQDIVSTIPVAMANNGAASAFASFSGTSMASPHVAGTIALLWAYAPEMTAQAVREELLKNSETVSFTKAVQGSRMMNLAEFMDGIKAKVAFIADDSGTLALNNKLYTLKLDTQESYYKIAKVEILLNDELIMEANEAVASVDIEIPSGSETVSLKARVTDVDGRVYESSVEEFRVSIDKALSFSELDLSSISGDILCQLVKKSSEEDIVIFDASLNSEASCRSLCAIIGPLAYNSVSKVSCGSVSNPAYFEQN